MVELKKASEVVGYGDSLEEFKIDKLFTALNREIDSSAGGDQFSVNTGVHDGVTKLNLATFQEARKLARDAGWSLTEHPDNYNTHSYRIKRRTT